MLRIHSFSLAAAVIGGLSIAASPVAHAGFGLTSHFGYWTTSDLTYGAIALGGPSIDYRQEKFVVQVQALETLRAFAEGDLHAGLTVLTTTMKGKVNEDWNGVAQPGLAVTFDQAEGDDRSFYSALGTIRIGSQQQKAFGLGVYVSASGGIARTYDPITSDDSLMRGAVGGELQVSTWLK